MRWLDAWTNDPIVALDMGRAPNPTEWYRFCLCTACGREGSVMAFVAEEVRNDALDLFMELLNRAERSLPPCPCTNGTRR
jgi:hypothetical protein